MNEIALVMSNVRPQRQAASGSATRRFEAMYPEQKPRWQFLSVDESAHARAADGAIGALRAESAADAPLALRAIPHGPRIGDQARGTVALWLVFANAVEGKDAEFNDWYDNRHIHDVVDLPGLISGQRFVLAPVAAGDPLPWKYLAIYEVEHDRVADTFAELGVRRGTARMPSPGHLAPGVLMATYQPID
jgi:hypothetical protein